MRPGVGLSRQAPADDRPDTPPDAQPNELTDDPAAWLLSQLLNQLLYHVLNHPLNQLPNEQPNGPAPALPGRRLAPGARASSAHAACAMRRHRPPHRK